MPQKNRSPKKNLPQVEKKSNDGKARSSIVSALETLETTGLLPEELEEVRSNLAKKKGNAEGGGKPSVATWEVLQEFGFVADSSVVSDVMPGISCDFGNFKLSASCAKNRRFADVVMFTGIIASKLSIGTVMFEMPRFIHSKEECAAWIVWNLDSYSDRKRFRPLRQMPWLDTGRANKHLLPWERDKK